MASVKQEEQKPKNQKHTVNRIKADQTAAVSALLASRFCRAPAAQAAAFAAQRHQGLAARGARRWNRGRSAAVGRGLFGGHTGGILEAKLVMDKDV